MYQKEENSVLFSLGNLRTLAMAPGSGVTTPHIPGDSTKMLDISRLAPALNLNRGASVGPSTLMGPRLAVSFPRWIIPVCIGFGTLLICIAILSLAIIYNKPTTKKLNSASVTTVEKRPLMTPPQPPAVTTHALKVAPLEQVDQRAVQQPDPGTADKPRKGVKDLNVDKSLPAAKPRKLFSKKKRRAYRRWQKRKALLKRRRARRMRAKAAKRRRAKRARLARAKRSRRDPASRSTKRRGSSKASEVDDLLTGF